MNRFIFPAIAMALLVPLSGFAGQDKTHDGNCDTARTAELDKTDSSSRELMYANLKDAVREVRGVWGDGHPECRFLAPGGEQSPLRQGKTLPGYPDGRKRRPGQPA
jgi:hypothetical protein